MWDNAAFIRKATTYDGRAVASRVSILPGFDVFFFRDRGTIKQLFRNTDVGSPIPIYTFAIKHFFGMPERAVRVYRADDSGSGPKPHPESNVASDARPFHITHKGLLRGLTGPGLGPTTRRCVQALAKNLQSYDGGRLPRQPSKEWIQVADLLHFLQHTLGSAMIEGHFGPTLLRLSPEYMDDLWELDAGMPWFSRQIPRLFVPGPHRARDRMIKCLTTWYDYARQNFDESHIDEHNNDDPIWGSGLNRERQQALRQVKEHDDRVIASLDVGHSWGSTTNVVGTTFMAVHHVFSDKDLLLRVRANLLKTFDMTNTNSSFESSLTMLDPKTVCSDTLLCAIYAEVLRLHGMAYFLVSAPKNRDVNLGRWKLPAGSMGLLDSGMSHMDPDFWNTRDGRHPVTEFWPDRFIVDPLDLDSGPVSPAFRERPYSQPKEREQDGVDQNQPYFSLQGTEGIWFPYGACLVLDFDIEYLDAKLEINRWRYGLGVDQPNHAVPFNIRRRHRQG
ncbi:hypothetical protein HIM_09927 [Hirsutella minnesotensis 3608]|uniref:Uncharacterized protein n=1 Tax=Hirsutella minnesotensis 3608 TaxID=1043627 RepID=A0A0F7ZXG5_9HYPO|nr:hypothetical protein HIM_09927 [Hirsutella minnesotensis 3608]